MLLNKCTCTRKSRWQGKTKRKLGEDWGRKDCSFHICEHKELAVAPNKNNRINEQLIWGNASSKENGNLQGREELTIDTRK